MADEDAILLEEGAISHSTYKPGEEFNVVLKVILHFVCSSDSIYSNILDQSIGRGAHTMYYYSC